MPSESAPKVHLIVRSDGDVTDDFLEGLSLNLGSRQRDVDLATGDRRDRSPAPPSSARARAAKLPKRPSSSSSIERKDYLRRTYDTNPYLKKPLQPSLAVRGRTSVQRASTGGRISSAESGFDVHSEVVNRALNLRLAGKNRSIEALESRNRQLTDKLHQLNRMLAQEQEKNRALSSELGRCRASMKKSSAEQNRATDETVVDLELLKEQLLDFHETIIGEREKVAQSKQRYRTLKSYANQLRADYEAASREAEANRQIADKLAPKARGLQVANAKLLVDLHTQSLCAAEQEAELAELRSRLQEAEQQLLSGALDADRLREALRGYRLSASRSWQKEVLNSPLRG